MECEKWYDECEKSKMNQAKLFDDLCINLTKLICYLKRNLNVTILKNIKCEHLWRFLNVQVDMEIIPEDVNNFSLKDILETFLTFNIDCFSKTFQVKHMIIIYQWLCKFIPLSVRDRTILLVLICYL